MKNQMLFSILLVVVLMGASSLLIHTAVADMMIPAVPTVKANYSGTNLASIPDGWTYSITGQLGIGCLQNPCVFLDNSVLFNGQSTVRIDASLATNNDPETDGSFYSISAGDHVVFSAYIKVTSNSVPEPVCFGAAIGVDFYGTGPNGYGRICGVSSPSGLGWTVEAGYPSDNSANTVPYGTSQWTYVSMDFIVPTQYQCDGFYTSYGANESTGTLVAPQMVVPWLFIYTSPGETAKAWFADTQFYVNPSVSSSNSTSNVTASKIGVGQSLVESGFVLPINVTVQNGGSVSEVASVELFANSTSIFNGTLSVDGSASGVLNCLVSTESLPIGNYTIDASVTALGEPNVTPNTISAGTVGVTYLGDLTGDFKVDSSSFFAFISDYITYWTTGYVNPAADFNHDGKIDFSDMQIFLYAYISYSKQGT
jgi:hypothetical protein